MEAIISGLVSGLIVTFLVVVFSAIWKSILIPWFENRVYKDARIEGAWYSVYPNILGHRQDIITLKREGHTITGTMVCTVSNNERGARYNISGSFRNMILPLIYEAEDKSSTDRGTITLKVTFGGMQMRGKVAVYSHHHDAIDDWDVIWFRNKTELDEFLSRLTEKNVDIKKYIQKQEEADVLGKEIIESATEATEEGSKGEQDAAANP